jgi:hypothetical protein
MEHNTADVRRAMSNRKLGLTLALIAVVFFLGVMVRMSLFGR